MDAFNFQLDLASRLNRDVVFIVIIQDAVEYTLTRPRPFFDALSDNAILFCNRLKFEVLNVMTLAPYLCHHN